MAGLGSTRNLNANDLELALVEKKFDEIDSYTFDEDSALSFDFECTPNIETLIHKIQKHWNRLRLRRYQMIEDERSFFAKLFAKLNIFVPPNPRPEEVKVLGVFQKQAGRFKKMADEDLLRYTDNKKVFFTTSGNDRYTQFYFKFMERGHYRHQPCVHAFKLSRFDFGLTFHCPSDVSPEISKMCNNVYTLRKETVKAFWKMYVSVFGYENDNCTVDHLTDVFETSAPEWFDFPFHFRVEADDPNLCDTVRKRIPEVASKSKRCMWPRCWVHEDGAPPFVVETFELVDKTTWQGTDTMSSECLLNTPEDAILNFKPRGKSDDELRDELEELGEEGEIDERLEAYPVFTYRSEVGGKEYLNVSNLRLSDFWELLDYIEIANTLKEDSVEDFEEDRKARVTAEIDDFLYLATALIRSKIRRAFRAVGLVVEEAEFPMTEEVDMLVGAPNSVLERRAENQKLRKIVQPRPDGTFAGGFMASMFLRGGPIEEFFTEDKVNRYLYHPYFKSPYSGDPACVFTHAERTRLIFGAMDGKRSRPDAEGKINPEKGGAETNLYELQQEGVIKDWYCIHDPAMLTLLRRTWASPWRRNPLYFITTGALQQDLNLLRNYFGERLAFYFAFVGYYTTWLIGPALAGGIIFFIRVKNFGRDDWEKEYFILPLFALVVAFWSTTFLGFLKRHINRKAYEWDVQEYHNTRKSIRPNFVISINKSYPESERVELLSEAIGLKKCGKLPKAAEEAFSADQLKQDLRANNELYYFPRQRQILQYWMNYPFVLCCIVVLFTVMLWIYAGFKFTVDDVGRKSGQLDEDSDEEEVTEEDFNRNVLLGVLNGIAIPAFNAVYKMAAVYITDLENHRSQGAFDDAVTMKVFAFQFVNSYSTLFFTAFWTQSLARLSTQLMTILLTGQVINNVTELVTPTAIRYATEIKSRLDDTGSVRAAQEELEARKAQLRDSLSQARTFIQWESRKAKVETFKPNYTALSADYLELIIQFGFVTMFVAAFPLAPVFAFVNNVIEIRIDASKLAYLTRKPYPSCASGIGVWMDLLEIMSFLSIICNVLLIGVTSPNRLEEDWFSCEEGETRFPCKSEDVVWLMVILEHVVIAFKMLTRSLIPAHPHDLTLDQFREEYFLIRETKMAIDAVEEGCHIDRSETNAEDDVDKS